VNNSRTHSRVLRLSINQTLNVEHNFCGDFSHEFPRLTLKPAQTRPHQAEIGGEFGEFQREDAAIAGK
jgi:hypothetical protein